MEYLDITINVRRTEGKKDAPADIDKKSGAEYQNLHGYLIRSEGISCARDIKFDHYITLAI